MTELSGATIPQAQRATAREKPDFNPLGGMIHIPGGTYRMGSDHHYREEAPAHRVSVDAFWMDRYPVTNRQFKDFVRATGYVTIAELAPDPRDYPGALPHMLYAGSLVFSEAGSPGRSPELGRVVALSEGRGLAASVRTGQQHQCARQLSGRARHVR